MSNVMMWSKVTRYRIRMLGLVGLMSVLVPTNRAQTSDVSAAEKWGTWLTYQLIPSFTVTTFPDQSHFALEWHASPVLYSLGMTRLISPWHFFFVEPPALFTGSVELKLTGQFYPSKAGSSHFAGSGQVLGHLPLIERGEYLGLTVGAASYWLADQRRDFAVAGCSTLFGFISLIVKYSPSDRIWMHTFEVRIF